jgi:hypothetical protein
MTGDAPEMVTVSASEPGLRVEARGELLAWLLPLTSRTAPAKLVADPVDVGAVGSAMAGAAVGEGGTTLRSVAAGSGARGIAVTAGAVAADVWLLADAVLGDDATDGSTIAICAG